jgi:tetratricopeptide (TPR) repeat protein
MPEYQADAILEMRLKEAKTAFSNGEFVPALLEAEELLDHHPDNLDALMLVGDSSLELGEAMGAEAAYCRFLEFEPESPVALSALAIARFELAEIDASIATAEMVLELAPEHAEAIYIKALAQEIQGKAEEANAGFARAAELAPEHYPLAPDAVEAEWPDVIEAAKHKLHGDLQEWLRGIEVLVVDYPRLEQLREHSPPLSPSSLVLYQGTPPLPGDDPWSVRPERMEIYRANVCRAGLRDGGLVGPVSCGLRREALEWIGLARDTYPLARVDE